MTISREDIEKGIEMQKKILGEKYVQKTANEPFRFPAWREWTQGTLFGQVWSRPELDLRTRSLCTVAALTALYRPEQLKVHIGAALNDGATPDEIAEVIMHMAFYAGWPVASTAMSVAIEVFNERGV